MRSRRCRQKVPMRYSICRIAGLEFVWRLQFIARNKRIERRHRTLFFFFPSRKPLSWHVIRFLTLQSSKLLFFKEINFENFSPPKWRCDFLQNGQIHTLNPNIFIHLCVKIKFQIPPHHLRNGRQMSHYHTDNFSRMKFQSSMTYLHFVLITLFWSLLSFWTSSIAWSVIKFWAEKLSCVVHFAFFFKCSTRHLCWNPFEVM